MQIDYCNNVRWFEISSWLTDILATPYPVPDGYLWEGADSLIRGSRSPEHGLASSSSAQLRWTTLVRGTRASPPTLWPGGTNINQL